MRRMTTFLVLVLSMTVGALVSGAAPATPDKQPGKTAARVAAKATAAAKTTATAKATAAAKTTAAARKGATDAGKPKEAPKAAAAPETTEEAIALEGEKLAPVLPSEQLFGGAAMGYTAARIVPHVCSKVFCYCGCDITDKHTCLLDCYTGMHGADCHICQEEAMQALKMSRDNQPLGTIQKTIDEAFASKYPFKEESPALKNYRATRRYSATGQPQAGGATPGEACCAGK